MNSDWLNRRDWSWKINADGLVVQYQFRVQPKSPQSTVCKTKGPHLRTAREQRQTETDDCRHCRLWRSNQQGGQLQGSRWLHRRSVRGVFAGRIENKTFAVDLSWQQNSCLSLFHLPDGPRVSFAPYFMAWADCRSDAHPGVKFHWSIFGLDWKCCVENPWNDWK